MVPSSVIDIIVVHHKRIRPLHEYRDESICNLRTYRYPSKWGTAVNFCDGRVPLTFVGKTHKKHNIALCNKMVATTESENYSLWGFVCIGRAVSRFVPHSAGFKPRYHFRRGLIAARQSTEPNFLTCPNRFNIVSSFQLTISLIRADMKGYASFFRTVMSSLLMANRLIGALRSGDTDAKFIPPALQISRTVGRRCLLRKHPTF